MKANPESQTKSNNSHNHQNFFGQKSDTSFFSPNTIQPKLTIGAPNDKYEKEADAMADKVVSMGESSSHSAVSDNSPNVQTKCEDCEQEGIQRMGQEEEKMVQTKPLMMKSENGGGVGTTALSSKLSSTKGSGSALPKNVNQHMSSAFGTDFSGVKIHTGGDAVQMNQGLGARAFTHGSDVYFNKGEYNPGSTEGKRLLGHELTHVVQQGRGISTKVQRVWVPDTGYRFTPPSSVTRTISEIQAIVGTTPDGIYGVNTKNAVALYQDKLRTKSLFSGTSNGEWDDNTDIGHIAHSTGSDAETYNCSGLAFKTFRLHGLSDTKSKVSSMTKLNNCSLSCTPRQYKFFLWEYNLTITDTGRGLSRTTPDFHIVGGQTDETGGGPSQVVSKNGKRPVKGPASPLSWKPATSETARENNFRERLLPGIVKKRTGYVESCFCSDKLPT